MKLFYLEDNKSILLNDEKISLDKLVNNIDVRKESHSFLSLIESFEREGFKVEDVFYYDDLPMYIFIRPNIAFWIRNIITMINVVESLKSMGNISEVVTDDYYMKVASEKLYNIKCEYEPKYIKSKSKITFSHFKRYSKGLLNCISFKMNLKKKDNLLMLSQAASISKVSIDNDEIYYDSKYGKVYEELSREYNVLNLEYLHSQAFIEKSLKYDSKIVPFEMCIFMKKILKDRLINRKEIKDNFDRLKDFRYNIFGIDITSIFLDFMNSTGKSALMSFLKEELYIERLIERNKIKKCIVIDEGDRGRCFIAAGNRLKVDTYALQHGMITEGSYSYDVNLEDSKYIVPKITFLWGDKFKDVLLNNTNIYNEDNLFVSGQPRTDFLDVYMNKETKRTSTKILFISQYMDDLVYPAGDILFKGINSINKNFELIIKLHPSDNKYEKYYKDEINKYKLQDKVYIAKDEDLYKLLEECDIVVSVHSTVVMEAAMLNKPSICIRLPKYDDVCDFVKDNISLGVYDEEELVNILDNIKISFNKAYFEKLHDVIEYNFNKIDGHVWKRIVDKMSEKVIKDDRV